MLWFDNLSLRSKLLLNFLTSGGVLIVAVLFCVLQIRSVGQDTREIAHNWLPSVSAVSEISQLRLRYRVRSLEYMLPGSPEEKTKIEKSLGELDQTLNRAFKKYETLISSPEERALYEQALAAAGEYKNLVEKAIALARTGQEDEAQQLRRSAWVTAANLLRDKTDALATLNNKGGQAAADTAEGKVDGALHWGIAALVAAGILALLASLLIARRLGSRLNAAVASARRIAGGDLTGPLPPISRDEIGTLLAATGEMQKALRDSMSETLGSVGDIGHASEMLNHAVRQIDLSASVQSTAASAIAANVEQLTVSINHISDSTQQAAALAQASDAQAAKGDQAIGALVAQINQVAAVVRAAAEQIQELKQESAKISSIVAVIHDIADQTNLLALNAAIEAARAGESGRGFAVVADEVRKLAERTATSTSEITGMVATIQNSTEQVVLRVNSGVALVDSSVQLAHEAGESITQLKQMADQVSSVMHDLDSGLREQSAASTDVAVKIEQIATQAEEVSASAHETASAAASMEKTAQRMKENVARFQI